MSLRVVFMGTPAFAVPTLSAVMAAGHTVAGVYTRAPKAAGRGMQLTKSPVHALAEAHGVPVFTPPNFRAVDDVDALRALAPDVIVVVAYGLLLPQSVLDIPRFGCLNVHASLLPRWRGAAPIHRAVMAGDAETGVAIMQMEAGLDTGPVARAVPFALLPTMTTGDAHDALSALGAQALVATLSDMSAGVAQFTPQPEAGVIYAHKIDKAEARIDWGQPAARVLSHIHGLSPFPGAWTTFKNHEGRLERLKILRARVAALPVAGSHPQQSDVGAVVGDGFFVRCADQCLELLEVQREGKRVVRAEEAFRGIQWDADPRLI